MMTKKEALGRDALATQTCSWNVTNHQIKQNQYPLLQDIEDRIAFAALGVPANATVCARSNIGCAYAAQLPQRLAK